MREYDNTIRISNRLGLRPALGLATALIVASAMLGATAIFFHQMHDWRQRAEMHRCTAMAEVYANQIAAASVRTPTELSPFVKSLDWHPSSRLLAVLDAEGDAVVIRGDKALLATYVEQLANRHQPRGSLQWYVAGDPQTHVPTTALAGVPIVRTGEKKAIGALVYGVRTAEMGTFGDRASLWKSIGAMGIVSCMGAVLGLCLLRYSVLEPLQLALSAVKSTVPSDGKKKRCVDEINAVAGLMNELQDQLDESRSRIAQLESLMDRRVQDETHKMSVQLRQVERKAWIDQLTKLGNRRMLDERFNEMFTAQRENGANLSVIMIDVDYFKTLNDTLGHKAGDELIAFIGELLGQCVRDNDMAIRYGGDEFILILPGVTAEHAAVIAERIIRLFGQRSRLLPLEPKPSMSAGVASLRQHKPPSSAAILQMADQALYQAKSEGKCCVRTYAPGMKAEVPARR